MKNFVLSYLLNSLWQVPLLFAVGWVAARAMRKLGPAAEHRVWVGALLLQSALPMCSALPWTWLQWLWHGTGSAHETYGARVTVEMGPGFGATGWHLPGTLLTLAAIAFGAVTIYFIARFAWRCAHLAALRRSAKEMLLNREEVQVWKRCEARFGVEGVTLARSPRIFAPVTMGIGKPVLLLPETMAGRIGEDDLLTVLAHEFAHIRRNDFAKNLFYELLSAPVSYHPLLHMTRERLTETREMVCDEMAAEITEPMAYGRSLLRLASLLVSGMPARTPHAIGIFDANTLERRLMRLKSRQSEVKGGRRVAMLLACAVMALATCASAVALHMNVDATAAASAKPNPKFVHVSPDVMQGNILHKVMPKYPVEAKKERIQGKVVLAAVISKEGAVEKLRVVSGPKELQKSALDAVRQWTYKPFLLNGQPIAVKTTINVIYSLQK